MTDAGQAADPGPTARRAARRRPRVVVVGGGFAGLSAVKALGDADVDVLLLDRNPYNTFQPLLYQVATGGLNPGDVTYSLRAFVSRFPNARFRRATVESLDTEGRRVVLNDGTSEDYDFLVLGLGVTANYFGVPGAQENAHTIYSRGEALHVRDRIFYNIEAAAQERPGAVEPVVVVVGGGATGVEMAGALAELRNSALPQAYPEIEQQRARVILVEMTDRLLSPFKPRLREYTTHELEKRGVELRMETAVKEVRPGCVVLSDGEEIPSAATIWATGVKAWDQVGDWGLPQGRGGRIQIEPDLRVPGHPEIFVAGDLAADTDEPLPQLAQPAMQGGRHAGLQIRRLLAGQPTEPFHYSDKGTSATIGRNDAVIQLPSGRGFKGFPAWVGWVAVHVFQLISNRNRLSTMVNLGMRYLTWPGNLNVIVGDPPD